MALVVLGASDVKDLLDPAYLLSQEDVISLQSFYLHVLLFQLPFKLDLSFTLQIELFLLCLSLE